MFAPIKRLIFDVRFYIQEWKMQRYEADKIDPFEEDNPMAALIAYKDMQRRHEERVRQHQIDRMRN